MEPFQNGTEVKTWAIQVHASGSFSSLVTGYLLSQLVTWRCEYTPDDWLVKRVCPIAA